MTKIHLTINFSLKLISVLFFHLLLVACNAGPQQASNGLGGTGITQGHVTGFGSIFVNGVKFNTENATFVRDGVNSKNQEDFSVGEIVTIKGTIASNKTTGVAIEVTFSNAIEGVVTKNASGSSIEVLGQTVSTNSLTVFIGFNKLSDLVIGNVVEVSGFTTNNGLTASSLKLISENLTNGSTQEVEGFIKDLNTSAQTFKLSNLTINYSSTQFENIVETNLENNLFLVISTDQETTNNMLTASKVTLLNGELKKGVFYEIEGFITKSNSQNSFEIDNNPVLINDQTKFANGSVADLSLDKHIIVTGTVNDQTILVAEEIKIIDSSKSTTIEASIESINMDSNSLVILGQTIKIDNFTLLSDETTDDFLFLNLDDFSVGDSTLISARNDQGVLTAIRLSKTNPVETMLLEGEIESVNVNLKSVSLFGNNIKVDSNTLYFDLDIKPITEATYFSILEENKTVILVIGNTTNELEILAEELFIIE